jgi:hypothetical protein
MVDWVRLEELVARLEAACYRGEWPKVDSFLPDSAPERRALLPELLHAEIELRLKSGQPVDVASYAANYEELASDPGAVRALEEAERTLRRRLELDLGHAPEPGTLPARRGGSRS